MEGGSSRVGPLNGIPAMYLFSLVVSLLFFQSGLFTILTPLPQMFCYIRLGRWAGMTMPLLILAVTGVAGSGVALGYLIQFAIPGVVFSESIVRRYSVEKSFLLALGVTVASIMLFLSLHASAGGLTVDALVRSTVQSAVDQVVVFNEKAGTSQEHLKEFERAAPHAVEFISHVYHSLIALMVMFTLWLNMVGLSRIMSRFGFGRPFGDLTRWRAPEHLVWVLIAAGVILFSGVDFFRVLAVNLLFVLLAIYFFQGMAIVAYYFNKKQLSGFLKGAGYAFIFVMWYLGVFVVALGLFDLWFDFRRLEHSEDL